MTPHAPPSEPSRPLHARFLPLLQLAALLTVVALLIAFSQAGTAQQPPAEQDRATLFQNVRVFDGKRAALSA